MIHGPAHGRKWNVLHGWIMWQACSAAPDSYSKGTAFTGNTGYADLTACKVDDPLYERQSEPVAFGGMASIPLIELVKDVSGGLFCNPAAGVAYGNDGMRIVRLYGYRNAAAFRCKFDGI